MSSSVKLHYILGFRLDIHLNVFFLVLLTLSDICVCISILEQFYICVSEFSACISNQMLLILHYYDV